MTVVRAKDMSSYYDERLSGFGKPQHRLNGEGWVSATYWLAGALAYQMRGPGIVTAAPAAYLTRPS